MKISKFKYNLNILLEYIIAFSIVINCNSVWMCMRSPIVEKGNYFIFNIAITMAIFLNVKKIFKNKRRCLVAFIVVMCIFMYNLIFIHFNNGDSTKYVFNYLLILIQMTLYLIINEEYYNNLILNKISDIIIIIASISIFMYIVVNIFKIVPVTSQITIAWGRDKIIDGYAGIFYNTQIVNIFGVIIQRNSAIFTEAPMFNYLLCISLANELFIRKNIKYKKIVILFIAIITTFTTTGIIIISIMFSIYVLRYKSKNFIYACIKVIIIPIVICSSVVFSYNFLKDKISDSSYKQGSYSVRINDIEVGIKAWKDNKLFGNGFSRHDITQSYMSYDRGSDNGGSSGLMTVIPQGGVILTMQYMLSYICYALYSIKNRNNNKLIFILFIFILFIVTNVPYKYMSIYFIALGISSLVREKSKNVYIIRS